MNKGKNRGDRKKAAKVARLAQENVKRLERGEFRLALPSDLKK